MQIHLPRVIRALSVLILIVFINCKSYSATPSIHIAPKPTWIGKYKPYDKKPAARSISDGAYDELVEEQINVEKKATYNHFITQIVSESGVQDNSVISASFDPAYEQLDIHEVVVWRNGKPQSRLNLTDFKILPQETELSKFIYNGTYSAKLILNDIRKGDKIEYSYTITGGNPIFNNKFCRTIYLQSSNPVAHIYTTLLFSNSRKINLKPFNQLSAPKISNTAGLTRYEWEDFQVPGITTYKHQPEWINLYARVQVSDYASWTEVIKWGLKINPIQTNFSGELAQAITKLKAEAAGNKEKYFRAAVKLVQNEVRYMGIETGPYSNKANDPDKVFNHRYGDCKDKSLLLASILNANGIEAHMALVNTALGNKLENFIPSTALFNHAVVVATLNNKQVWVDATMNMQGGKGTDIYFPNYGDGLILKADNNGLTKIKPVKAGKIAYEEKYTATDEHSPVNLKVTTTYTLSEADDVRSSLASKSTAETEKDYLEYYAKKYPKIQSTDSVVIKDNLEKNVLVTIENYKVNDLFKRDSINGKYNADFYASFISRQLPEIPPSVNKPVWVNYPCNIDQTIIVDMPNGWDMLDEQDSLYRDAYLFKFNKIIKNDRLTLHYQFSYLKDNIPAEKLNEFRQDVKDLDDDKLYFTFYSIPNVDKVPFALNKIILVIGLIIIALSVFVGNWLYKTETAEHGIYGYKTYTSTPISGWLWVLLLSILWTTIEFLQYLVKKDYFSTRMWDFYLTGVDSIKNRALIVFEATSYMALICFSLFCLFLLLKKRDIAPWITKIFYASCVIFLLIDCFFKAYMNNQSISNYTVEQIIHAVIAAVIWTYYLNTSVRVEETFVVPYPD